MYVTWFILFNKLDITGGCGMFLYGCRLLLFCVCEHSEDLSLMHQLISIILCLCLHIIDEGHTLLDPSCLLLSSRSFMKTNVNLG